jgi:hypothetical protein
LHVESWVLPEPVVEHYDPECIQELTLVLVDAFDLAVEDRLWINDLSCRPAKPVAELSLGISLGLAEVIAEATVLGECSKLA